MNFDQLSNFFQRAIEPLKHRVLLMVGRALITATNDAGGLQLLQVKSIGGEPLDKVPRFQEFGFSSRPPDGTEAIILNIAGNRDNAVVIATEHRNFRIQNLAKGESIIYTDDGTKIHLKKNGHVELTAATKVLMTVPDVEITGNLKVGGTTHGVGKATYDDEVEVTKDIKGHMNIIADISVQAPLVQAAAYSGPTGSPGVNTTEPITTTANITAANVIGGGTDLASVKATFNAHQHSDPQGGNTGTPTTTL